jgi:hypothetical protein
MHHNQIQARIQRLLVVQLYKQHFAADQEEDEDGDGTGEGEDDPKDGQARMKRQVCAWKSRLFVSFLTQLLRCSFVS